ncbi:decaprenyl-phosphate phosphoribosyltransferase [Clostridium sp. DJ247]|nr:decaprenyl-phosphate phosphoribosyltransferase [Clostridium sp. DJ247]
MRPKQWVKNFFIFAAILFSHNIFVIDFIVKTVQTFLLFCFISSSVYIINDIVDLESDKKHPRKKFRPIASGIIKRSEALIFLILILIITFIWSFQLNIKLGIIITLYLINNLLYSIKLKNIVIVDVMLIAFGFVLRVYAGTVVINVDISPWLILCTLLLSLFLGFSKRRNELVTLKEDALLHRASLEKYSIEFIDSILISIIASTIVSYSIYTFLVNENRYMMITIPIVLYSIFRFQYLSSTKSKGYSPDEILLSDLPLVSSIFLWAIACIIILYIL